MRMNWKLARLVLMSGGIAAVVVVALMLSNVPQESPQETVSRRTVLTKTLKWARMAPIPRQAKPVMVKDEGSMFARRFIVEFHASAADVRKWLSESPGVKGVRPVSGDNSSQRYVIKPAGGTQSAEVVVSNKGTKVRIQVSWS